MAAGDNRDELEPGQERVENDRWSHVPRYAIGILMVGSFAALMVLIPYFIFEMMEKLKLPDKAEILDKVALVGSLQVGLGMYLGFVVTFLGTAMSWLGVRETFSLAARARSLHGTEGRLAYQSAGPGLLFAALGVLLIWASLYKRIEMREGGGVFGREDARKQNTLPQNPPPSTENSRDVPPGEEVSLPGQCP